MSNVDQGWRCCATCIERGRLMEPANVRPVCRVLVLTVALGIAPLGKAGLGCVYWSPNRKGARHG
jgi:hypothetical protein